MTEYQTATKNGEIVDKYTSPTPDPEPSQASPHCVKHQPTNESSPRGATELKVALEPVPHWSSDQVREPATMHATVESPTHSTTAEGELRQDSGDFIDFYSEVLLPSSSELIVCPETTMEVCFELFICLELSVCPVMTMEVGFELSACLGLLSVCLSCHEHGVAIWCVWAACTISETLDCHELPPSLPLPPPLQCSLSSSIPLSLHPASPSAHPQPSFCGLDLLWACQSPASSRSEDPRSPPPTFETQTPPRPVDPAAPPWLLACQSTSFAGLPHTSGTPFLRLRIIPPSLWLH